jgi:hypothetical protein
MKPAVKKARTRPVVVRPRRMREGWRGGVVIRGGVSIAGGGGVVEVDWVRVWLIFTRRRSCSGGLEEVVFAEWNLLVETADVFAMTKREFCDCEGVLKTRRAITGVVSKIAEK